MGFTPANHTESGISLVTQFNLDDVRHALALEPFDVLAAWQAMAPIDRPLRKPPEAIRTTRPAGVLLLLYPGSGGVTFALTRRTDDVATHKGQVSLPGGAVETGESPETAALREACEELGICDPVTVIGKLTPLYVHVSDFEIHPFVGYLPHRPSFIPQPGEVAEVLEMTLDQLIDDAIKANELWTLQGTPMNVPFYRLGESIVWGATAIILSEFEGRLRSVH